MTRSHCVFFLCALYSLPVHSGSVAFAQWVPWNFVSQEMKKHELDLREERPSLSLELGELKPELRDVSVTVRGRANGITAQDGAIVTEAQGSLNLNLGSIRIDQTIQREFGGNVISVRIQATCTAASVDVPSLSLLSAFSLQNGPDPLPVIRDFSVQIPAGTWSVSPVHCEGLSGIGEEIETSLNSALKDPGLFSPLLREWLAPRMNRWIREQWPLIANGEDWSDLRIADSDDDGFLVRGEIVLAGSEEIPLPEKLPDALTDDSPRFFMARAGYEALIQDRLRALLPQQYDLRQNESFRRLMGSRFMQYIAWPDLRRFHSSTPFVLKTDPSSLKLSLKPNAADLSGRGNLVTLIGGSPIDYLVYSMNVSVPVKMELQNGDLYFSTGKAAAKITWSFGYLYRMIYKPEGRVPENVLTASLAGLASGRTQRVALPRFQLGDRELIFSDLRFHENLITMEWP